MSIYEKRYTISPTQKCIDKSIKKGVYWDSFALEIDK